MMSSPGNLLEVTSACRCGAEVSSPLRPQGPSPRPGAQAPQRSRDKGTEVHGGGKGTHLQSSGTGLSCKPRPGRSQVPS